jgi:hypothetical protein
MCRKESFSFQDDFKPIYKEHNHSWGFGSLFPWSEFLLGRNNSFVASGTHTSLNPLPPMRNLTDFWITKSIDYLKYPTGTLNVFCFAKTHLDLACRAISCASVPLLKHIAKGLLFLHRPEQSGPLLVRVLSPNSLAGAKSFSDSPFVEGITYLWTSAETSILCHLLSTKIERPLQISTSSPLHATISHSPAYTSLLILTSEKAHRLQDVGCNKNSRHASGAKPGGPRCDLEIPRGRCLEDYEQSSRRHGYDNCR